MLTFGITTVDKTFRIDCKVIDEEFRGWFDLKGEEVTARRVPGQLIRAKKYVEERGNVYTLVIRKVQFVDGGNYTCRGDKTEKIFSLFVECKYYSYDDDDDDDNYYFFTIAYFYLPSDFREPWCSLFLPPLPPPPPNNDTGLRIVHVFHVPQSCRHWRVVRRGLESNQQMTLQRQHFLLTSLKNLKVGPIGVCTRDLHNISVLNQLSQTVGGQTIQRSDLPVLMMVEVISQKMTKEVNKRNIVKHRMEKKFQIFFSKDFISPRQALSFVFSWSDSVSWRSKSVRWKDTDHPMSSRWLP